MIPQVSVVMPVYNSEKTVCTAIESLLSQTYIYFEVIVIDDGSTDRTWDVLTAFSDSRIRLFRNKTNIGYLKSVNFGFTQCQGDYITFQDADDWSVNTRIEKQCSALNKSEQLSLCGTQCCYVNENEKSISNYPCSFREITLMLEEGENALFCGATLMIKSDIFEEIGGYNELFNRIGSEDLDWYLRVINKYTAINLDEALYFYRQGKETITRSLNFNPLKYHSAELAMHMHLERQTKPYSEEQVSVLGEKEKKRIMVRYDEDKSKIYRVVGINQLLNGNVRAYLICGAQSKKAKGSAFNLLLYLGAFIPLFLIAKLKYAHRKKIFRCVKKIRTIVEKY